MEKNNMCCKECNDYRKGILKQMHKLYVVDNGDPSGDRMNVAIFDNEELAKEFCEEQNKNLDKWASGKYDYETYEYDNEKQRWINQDI